MVKHFILVQQTRAGNGIKGQPGALNSQYEMLVTFAALKDDYFPGSGKHPLSQ